jgi:D-lactate dehydrogenase
LIADLRNIVGKQHTLTDDAATRRYRTGFRFGAGKALAVVRPGTIVEQWQVLQACIAANVIVITQASNTGLTGGSTPDGNDYDRDIVIVSTSRMKKVYVIDNDKQVVCLPGATLDQLEKTLKPLGREPHSVIGSSCIGASVFGGVCNNSGGALVQRGPAYTEMALFGQVDAAGKLNLVNHLGIELGDTPEDILGRLDRGEFTEVDIRHNAGAGSDHGYATHVREIDADTPARFNADPQRLHEASGSAGKVMVFGVRLDTFPIEQNARVFYIGTNAPDELTAIRRHALHDFKHLPISGEYLHRDAFDIAEKYGKDTFLAINYLGTSRLPALFGLKSRFDALFDRLGFLPSHLTDRVMQAASRLFPSHLPPRMKQYRDKYVHHLMLKVSAESVEETRAFLSGFFAKTTGGYFECTDEEGRKAFLHRFAAAGAAVRYRAVHNREVEDIVALESHCDAMIGTGSRRCRPRSKRRSRSGCTTATSSATCSTRITSSRRVTTALKSNTRCGRCWTAAARNIQRNTMSVICTTRSPNSLRFISGSIPATVSIRGSDRRRSSRSIGKLLSKDPSAARFPA